MVFDCPLSCTNCFPEGSFWLQYHRKLFTATASSPKTRSTGGQCYREPNTVNFIRENGKVTDQCVGPTALQFVAEVPAVVDPVASSSSWNAARVGTRELADWIADYKTSAFTVRTQHDNSATTRLNKSNIII